MKRLLTLVGAICFGSALNAQTPVEQGNFIIDAYAGIPNWANAILYNNVEPDENQSNVQDYKVNGSMLSYGGRFEYMVADNMGVGADVNYEVSGFNYDYDAVTGYDGSGNPIYSTYNIDYRAKKLRIMARLNYHFVQNDRVDVYSGFAGGYKSVNRVTETTDPSYDDSELNGALIPVSFRLAIGTRVYFTDNIGAMVELGAFGGALFQFGLSAKF
jgi:hypothetical protein